MASVTKYGEKWQYTAYRYTNGKFNSVTFTTKKEAQVAAPAIKMRLQKGTNILTRDRVFVEYFESWIEKYKTNKYKNTYRHYEDS
ncbi:hypothetical protein ACQKII_09680 [Lysinibacillus sp. NPDC048646]|uniref:hypothetical protein n=1 Tax=Lysinibacillus sp. NPDC048646 TaxID=3390574 RepID=UPI003D075940